MSESKLTLHEKMMRIIEQLSDDDLSRESATDILEELRRAYPDTDKLLLRRFARLPTRVQRRFLDIIARAQANAYTTALQAWSRDNALSLAVRRQALAVLEQLGEAVDAAYRDGIVRAEQQLTEIRTHLDSALTDTGELRPACREAILNLPLALALDLSRELAVDQPVMAVAVVRAIRPVVDAQECQVLVDTLGGIAVSESADLLQQLLSETTNKVLQKSIKKALHRLKAQGLRVDEKQPAHRAVVGSVVHHLETCYASHIDAVGDRVFWMIRTKPLGGYNIAYVVLNYGSGIKAVFALQASKRELPGILAQAQEHVRLIELEPSYCQHQVALAHQMNLETGTPVPEEFFAARDIIGEPDKVYEQAFIYTVLSETDLQEAEAYAGHAEDLLELPEFAGWTLPDSVIQKYADQLREIEESQIVISPALKRERLNEVYAQAAEDVLNPHSRRLMRLRLEEMAYYLWQTERRREALCAVAAARSLETDDRDRLRRNPFAGALLERSLESAKERPASRIIQPFSSLSR